MKTANKKMSAEELRWQAQDDCRVLEEYQQIISDKARLDRAMKAAKEKVSDLQDRAKALGKSLTGLKSK
jgi:hypothetical protein